MMRLIPLLACLASAATVKDVTPTAFSGLAKVYANAPFRTRLEVKALAAELNSMGTESDKDKVALGKRCTDSTGNWLRKTQAECESALDALQKTPLPLKTRIPVRILLPEARVDSLHLTLFEDLALTPFVQIVADTSKAK